MDLFAQLSTKKGTVSSALGKELAESILNGDQSILEQAIMKQCVDSTNFSLILQPINNSPVINF